MSISQGTKLRCWNWLYEFRPSLSYREIIRALQRDGWVVIRQRGSHIRLQKHAGARTMKLTVPAHNPVKRSTLSRILKQAELELDRFLELL